MRMLLATALLTYAALISAIFAEDGVSTSQRAEDTPKESLAVRLGREKTGELDDNSKPPVNQIEEAHDRFVKLYLQADSKDEEQAVRETFDKVYDRILKRADDKIKEAKQNLEFSKRPKEAKGERT